MEPLMLTIGWAVVAFIVFIISVAITRWMLRIDDIIDRLDRLIKAVEGPAKPLVIDKTTMEGLKL